MCAKGTVKKVYCMSSHITVIHAEAAGSFERKLD
jgi:hypothetical protein